MREARAAAAAASGGSEDLEAEVQALFDELSTQRAILDRCAHSCSANPQRIPLVVHSFAQPRGCLCSAPSWTGCALCRHFAGGRQRVPPYASRIAVLCMLRCGGCFLHLALCTGLSGKGLATVWMSGVWQQRWQARAHRSLIDSACASKSAGRRLCRKTYRLFCPLFRYRTEESEVRAELKKISDERQRVKALQDEAYGRIVGARNEKRDKSRVWGDNRLAFPTPDPDRHDIEP